MSIFWISKPPHAPGVSGGAFGFAREAAELKIDAVADMHNVLRSKMVRAALHLRGIPVSVIHKGRIENTCGWDAVRKV